MLIESLTLLLRCIRCMQLLLLLLSRLCAGSDPQRVQAKRAPSPTVPAGYGLQGTLARPVTCKMALQPSVIMLAYVMLGIAHMTTAQRKWYRYR